MDMHYPGMDSEMWLNTEEGSEAVTQVFFIGFSWFVHNMWHGHITVTLCVYTGAPP